MTDIVERLRRGAIDCGLAIGDAWNLCDEAADEIERLRFALGSSVSWADEMKKKDTEIERLREALAHVALGGEAR